MNLESPSQPQTGLRYKTYFKHISGIYEKPIAKVSTALILTLITITFFGFAAIRPTLATVSELIKETVTRTIDGKVARSVAAANPEYAAVIESARTVIERPFYVIIKR